MIILRSGFIGKGDGASADEVAEPCSACRGADRNRIAKTGSTVRNAVHNVKAYAISAPMTVSVRGSCCIGSTPVSETPVSAIGILSLRGIGKIHRIMRYPIAEFR